MGTFCGLIGSDGRFSVTPRRFINKGGTFDKRVFLSCKTDRGETVQSNDDLLTGCRLTFTLMGLGGVLDGSPEILWEVCNAGYGVDEKHHDIYPKEEEGDGKNRFTRDLSYVGTHLLRCAVFNKEKKFAQQIVFVVSGH